jgi:hypothetical protein
VTPLARFVAVAAGIVSLLLCGAAFVRQAALAADRGVTWQGSVWWGGLTARSSAGTIVAAAIAAAVTLVLVLLAYRQVSPSAPQQIIEFAVTDGTARLSVPALSKALRRRFQSMLPGSQVNEIAVALRNDAWTVRVEADLPVCDLQDVHRAVFDAFRDDMRRVASVDLARLDLVVTSMRSTARKAS